MLFKIIFTQTIFKRIMATMLNIKILLESYRYLYRYIKYAAAIFLIGILYGYYLAMTETEAILSFFQELFKDLSGLDTLGPVTLFLVVFFNNSIKTFFMMFLGIFFGIIPALFVFFNGFLLGVVSYLGIQQSGITALFLGIVPHGIIEIPTMIIASGYGLWLGRCTLRKLTHKELLRPHIAKASYVYMRFFVPLLFVAAFVEVFVTGYLLKTFA